MTPTPYNRILIVDDSPAVLTVFKKILTDAGVVGGHSLGTRPILPALGFDVETALQGNEALVKVVEASREGRPFALAFVDVLMPPGWDGIETIARMWEADPNLQIVVCTACVDCSWEKITARLGVNENFVILKKPFETMEVLQLGHALTRKWHVTREARARMESLDHGMALRAAELETSNAQLRLSEERFAKAFRSSPMPLAIQTLVGQRFVDVNDAFLGLTGFSRAELIGHTPVEVRLCIDYETHLRRLVTEGKTVRDVAAQISTRGGELLDTLISIERLTLTDEVHTLMMVQDISERLHLENQLRQAQKMEAIGQLAAGVAHDFNNMLTIIQGHASLQLAATGLSTDTIESLQQITLAADRAANLTRQLLAFSRRQIMRPRVLRLNDLLRELTSMLRRLIGENIELCCDLAERLPAVWADSTGVEQVLMNLTLNARDAMPRGGRITIKTELATVSASEAERDASKRSGEYAVLSVQDSGSGMDASTRARIFEPFFTTKEVNKGTGMGLATVYGIVSQHEGWIDVETAPGAGSTFRVFLPATDQVVEEDFVEPFAEEFYSGQHTILVVEDDEAVRSMVRDVLEHSGYRVIEAEHAAAALEVAREYHDEIELLLTDVMMPGELNGLDLARALLDEMPSLKVIYTSGYSAELFASGDLLSEGVNYLPKPYAAARLIAIVRGAFDDRAVLEPSA
jgi:PAS domain S-box-containing protein